MPYPRIPSAILEATGAFKHNPARRRARAGEPVPGGPLGDAPAQMPPEVAECWRRIVQLAPAGVLCDCDEAIVEQTARLMVMTRSPHCKITAHMALRMFLRELGMTPASRSLVSIAPKVFAPGESTGNPFADV
jgi:phage terminase small subunit